MIISIILTLIAIFGMFLCIIKFPTLKIKFFSMDSFYLPILFIAILFLILPLFDKTDLFAVLFSNSSLNPIKILILFISVSFLSIVLDEVGFFNFIASIFINKFKSSQFKLFIILYFIISILTIFTSNDIVILTFTPFILYFAKKGNINPIPYLVMEFVAANTYSMVLSIGNPTNIYLSSVYSIPFLDYFIHMLIPTILCGTTSFITLFLLFKNKLKKPITLFEFKTSQLKNKKLCVISLIHLLLTTLLLAISTYIHLDMWIICLSFAISLLLILIIYSLKSKNYYFIKSSIRRVPYSLIPFVLSMFVIIMALDSFDIFKNISTFFTSITNPKTESILYLTSSTISSNLINNIPMTLAYGSILSNTNQLNLVYATIIGSNIGALLTPVGSLAGIMWLKLLKVNHIKYSFLDFMRNGILLLLLPLISLSLYLLIL